MKSGLRQWMATGRQINQAGKIKCEGWKAMARKLQKTMWQGTSGNMLVQIGREHKGVEVSSCVGKSQGAERW